MNKIPAAAKATKVMPNPTEADFPGNIEEISAVNAPSSNKEKAVINPAIIERDPSPIPNMIWKTLPLTLAAPPSFPKAVENRTNIATKANMVVAKPRNTLVFLFIKTLRE